jgi:hypothetical protein
VTTSQEAHEFRFGDPRQRRIHERLQRLIGPGPAAFFRDACFLIEEEIGLEAPAHAIGHYLRDIDSAIRKVMGVLAPPSASREGRNGDADHRDSILAILAGLGISPDDRVGQFWLGLAGKGNFRGLAARAHRDALRRPRPLDPEFSEFWEGMQHLLDVVLDRFESRFSAVLPVLESLLSKSHPTSSDAKLLANQVPENPILRRSFFARAGDNWLAPLREEGFFRRVPSAVQVTGGGLAAPIWSESAYLARMANGSLEAQRIALEISLSIAETNNFWVQEDLLDVALALPPDFSAKFAPGIKTWLSGPVSVGLPEKAGKLIRHLVSGGEVRAALSLASALLTPKVKEDHSRPSEPFDLWHYEQILRNDVPELVRVAGHDAFALLCDLLEQAVRTSEGDFRDHSQAWRPSIADHAQNELSSIESALVSAVRDASVVLTEQRPVDTPNLVRELESRRYSVFRRLALHVLRAAGQHARDLTEKYVADRDRFLDSYLLPEYVFLLRDSFGYLSAPAQAKVLEFINRGPELDVGRYQDWLGRPPTTADIDQYRDEWQFEKLGFIEASLSGEWRERYDRLLTKFGRPRRPPEFRFWSTSWVGPTSPVGKDALAALTDDDLIVFLTSWRSPGGDMSPSPGGLSRELTSLVTEQPTRFSVLAQKLAGLSPMYIAASLRGFVEALRKGFKIEWLSVLTLCAWALDQEDMPAAPDIQGEWSVVREEATYLLQEGFSQKSGDRGVPFSLRDQAWSVIECSVRDADPTPAREAKNDGDPYGTAINSARGTALIAAVGYGLWVRRNLDREAPGAGLAEMPELRSVLEEHLDLRRDSSMAIRSVYGRHFPQLAYLDRAWVSGHTEQIFPRDRSLESFRKTAWDWYLQGPFFEPCYSILAEHYSGAVDEVASVSSVSSIPYSPIGHLAGHLMTLYWQGVLSIDDPEGILVRFFALAPDPLRAEAVDVVGRSLGGDPSDVPNEVRVRLERFWVWRIAQAERTGEQDKNGEELASFGRWFASSVFEDEWALERFRETLRLSDRLRPSHLELGRLAALAEARPREAVECLRLMIDRDQDGMLLLGGRDESKAILAAGIASNDSQARNQAVELINRLISRGHLGFRELLPALKT